MQTTIALSGAGLDKRDRLLLSRTIFSSVEIGSEKDFRKWSRNELRELLPHEAFWCGAGQVGGETLRIEYALAEDFPDGFVATAPSGATDAVWPVLSGWLRRRQPFLLDPDRINPFGDYAQSGMLDRWELRNLAVHGTPNLGGGQGSCFMLARIPAALDARYAFLSALIAPYLHAALLRVRLHSRTPRPRQ